ncbi:MAG TPA: hypothetical protein VL282_12605, partial [Tepidisphaeraceae bacterium]|nr:hypothetical protein [Tepidisphaeraceae bacterium]
MANLKFLMQRSFASQALSIVKMKQFVPCDVQNQFGTYKSRIVDVVYDPLRVEEVNARFKKDGCGVAESDPQVIAVNEDGSILLWGGLNSVFHLRKGEETEHCLDRKHMAFQDIVDLTNLFKKIKNK